MPDVSHGRKVFRCSQARVLIALIIRSLDLSQYTQLFDSDIAPIFSYQIPSLRTTSIVDRVTTTAGASTYE